MKRTLFTLLSLLFACLAVNAQMKVLINKSGGAVDTYPFSESTKITFSNGDININSTSKSKTYSPTDIQKMTFGANVSSITLSQTSASIEVGDKMALIATVLPANAVSKELQWSSSNEDIAMVSQKGIVLAMGEGTATITVKATDGSGVKTSCTIKVEPVMVKSISLNHEIYSLNKGESLSLVATVIPENAKNKDVSWSSSDEDVVMVSQSGKVVYLGNGSATVTATAKDGSGVSASCTFTCVTGIVTITSDNNSFNIYDSNGVVHPNVKRGLNIIKMYDGTSKKILIR